MTAAQIVELLEKQAIDAVRSGMRGYFKEPIDPRGVPAPAAQRIASQVYKAIKKWPLAQRNRLCTDLWKSGKHEDGLVAAYVYRRFTPQCTSCEFHLFEKWIDRFVTNWAQCDTVAAPLLGACIENEPALAGELPAWTQSANRWKRRAAAVALIKPASKGGHTEMAFTIAGSLMRDPDDMVQKGAGWLLKVTYPKKPRETVAFLMKHKHSTPRLVLRYAAEKMSAADRQRILG